MRTVRRQVVELNPGKKSKLRDLIEAFAAEKQHWLDVFARADHRHLIKQQRLVRDAALAGSYESVSGLQARMWKLALTDAAQTWDKYWKALFVEVRRKIEKRTDFDPTMRHYAYWLLSGYSQFSHCLDGESPVPTFKIDPAVLPKVAGYVRHQVAKLRGNLPSVKIARSAILDANCYTVFTQGGTQYIKIMTLVHGQRIVLPLSGQATITGNIRIVMDADRIEVHVPQALPEKKADSGVITAVDFGYTEAMTDAEGKAYGEQLGQIITQASNERHCKGKARNRLRDLAKKLEASSSPKKRAKARNIRRCNLGKLKWNRRERKAKAAIACEINQGLNQLIESEQPSVLVTEDLRHAFTFDKPKSWNRKLSAWAKGVMQDRTEFKALAEGFRHEQVNPAYGSQTCSCCGYVDAKNRNGDRFVCLHCGHKGHADQVAATNILHRNGDPEITRYTPYRDVKTILMQRFHRRLEAKGAQALDATVPGRTSETELATPQQPARRKSQQEGASRSNLTVNRRAKQTKNGVANKGDYV